MIGEKLGNYNVVDLSRHIDPITSKRLCKVRRFFQESSKDYHSDLTVESHLGTHVETPYHYNSEWKDILGLPLTAFMGRGVILNLQCKPLDSITRKMLDVADKGRVKQGDVVILTSSYHCEPFSNDPDDQRPYLCRESGEWFVEKKVKCIGFGDGVAIEHSVKDACDVHETVMPHNIMFLEVMENLDKLTSDIFLIVYQPMPIKGLDSCCVRAFAIEGIPGFC
jgi:kynurenine formamidase